MTQDWVPLLVNATLADVGKGIDLLSTWYVTPRLRLKTGGLISKFGWKGAIALQLPVIMLASFHLLAALFVFVFFFSLFLTFGNVQGAWFVRRVGEKRYFRLMIEAGFSLHRRL